MVPPNGSAAKSDDMIWLSTFDNERRGIVLRFGFLLLCQLFILWSIGKDAFTLDFYVDKYDQTPSIAIVLSRYFTMAFLHIKLASKHN